MRKLVLLASAVLLAGCAGLMAGAGVTATADLHDASGQRVGAARLEDVSGGVHLVLEMTGMPPGPHAVHVHAVGRCDPPGFASAGGHFNPAKRQHGVLNPQGPHAGDLPNITIDPDGRGRLETTNDRITLHPGPDSILDADGRALVVHAGPDDFKTDPAGGSGARIACGVIVKQEPLKAEPIRY